MLFFFNLTTFPSVGQNTEHPQLLDARFTLTHDFSHGWLLQGRDLIVEGTKLLNPWRPGSRERGGAGHKTAPSGSHPVASSNQAPNRTSSLNS